jgi:Phage regulatory protein Rha (Phage_pRha)
MDIATLTTITGMDSREIAEQTKKNHADVCRDIRKMVEDLGEPESRFASGYQDAQGQNRRCFILPKRECLIQDGRPGTAAEGNRSAAATSDDYPAFVPGDDDRPF